MGLNNPWNQLVLKMVMDSCQSTPANACQVKKKITSINASMIRVTDKLVNVNVPVFNK